MIKQFRAISKDTGYKYYFYSEEEMQEWFEQWRCDVSRFDLTYRNAPDNWMNRLLDKLGVNIAPTREQKVNPNAKRWEFSPIQYLVSSGSGISSDIVAQMNEGEWNSPAYKVVLERGVLKKGGFRV